MPQTEKEADPQDRSGLQDRSDLQDRSGLQDKSGLQDGSGPQDGSGGEIAPERTENQRAKSNGDDVSYPDVYRASCISAGASLGLFMVLSLLLICSNF
jgi:hypothetical protein